MIVSEIPKTALYDLPHPCWAVLHMFNRLNPKTYQSECFKFQIPSDNGEMVCIYAETGRTLHKTNLDNSLSGMSININICFFKCTVYASFFFYLINKYIGNWFDSQSTNIQLSVEEHDSNRIFSRLENLVANRMSYRKNMINLYSVWYTQVCILFQLSSSYIF